eukprot:COSAG06_NODE_15192_length_1091_cov_1.115927_1_plen_23_part_10
MARMAGGASQDEIELEPVALAAG